MIYSAQYKQLDVRLKELRKNLLPLRFSKLGNYNSQQLDQARGYKLLAHAEIEFYLEEVAKKTIIDALKNYKADPKPIQSIFSLLASYHSGFHPDGDSTHNEEIINLAKSRRKIKETISEIINAAQAQYTTVLKDNNGIKEKNLRSLLTPIGIEINDLDNTWLADMDTFGAERGLIAHTSTGTNSKINPKDELKKINALIIGIKKLDIEISKLNK